MVLGPGAKTLTTSTTPYFSSITIGFLTPKTQEDLSIYLLAPSTNLPSSNSKFS